MDYIEYIDRKSGEICKETVPGEKWLKWLYHNPLGKLALHGAIKRKFVSQWYGNKMDSPASKDKIPGFIKDLNIDMNEAIRPMEDYGSFNDFFIRELKAEARPIDNTSATIVSPAEGKILAFEGIQGLDSFFVKGQQFSLNKFLQNSMLSKQYEEGTLLIIRLAPVDYHRFHFPADGTISASSPINGDYFSVSPYAVKNMLRVYWENKREYSILKTAKAGNILLCEVGATMVGSIIQSYTPDSEVKKGQEKGCFKFGGSTVIMLLEKGKAQIDADIIKNTQNGFETSIKIGETIATVCD
ncbi:phosphatidylserine decarboxylase [Desulfovibrio sp. JC022]|uniref:phosphatidylserine decarboxylase n=1 Tax=Desulfovibrio sp. JC022 TaxID=2593642 RepID=UPI0013D35845|nr:phosphatidylserine decarboxylase [Desulfovibrio sp. JC022]NDV24747.1 phosphatidylserine decarboxylase [Desulfovibrio sp. JC022]